MCIESEDWQKTLKALLYIGDKQHVTHSKDAASKACLSIVCSKCLQELGPHKIIHYSAL